MAVVKTHDEIQKAYCQLKLLYPEAQHIICAYYLPGSNQHTSRDYCDDGYHGAGCFLLELLIRSDCQNRAIFVARFPRGQKLGVAHFKCFAEVAKSALEAMPYNYITNADQGIKQQTMQEQKSEGHMRIPTRVPTRHREAGRHITTGRGRGGPRRQLHGQKVTPQGQRSWSLPPPLHNSVFPIQPRLLMLKNGQL